MELFPNVGASVQFELSLANVPPEARLLAASIDGQEVVQLQPSWFACNWRKVRPSDGYDRWSSRRSAFEHWLRDLLSYLEENGIELPTIRQCEVTYTNHIEPGAVWEAHADWRRVFRLSIDSDVRYPIEQLSVQAQLLLVDENDDYYGRLHAKILPAYARDGKTPLYVFELTARGVPRGKGVAEVLALLDRGREAVNHTFVHLTTDEMHAEWGRQ